MFIYTVNHYFKVCFAVFHEKNELRKNENQKSKIWKLFFLVKILKTNFKIVIYSVYGHHLTLFYKKIYKYWEKKFFDFFYFDGVVI